VTIDKPYCPYELISRYKQRLTRIYSNPNPYINNPEQERASILSKIKEIKTKEGIK